MTAIPAEQTERPSRRSYDTYPTAADKKYIPALDGMRALSEFPVLAQVAIGLVPIFIAASLSYYLVERPVLSLRAKWRS